nr:glutathione S-transferase A1-like [Aotus nancymaae]
MRRENGSLGSNRGVSRATFLLPPLIREHKQRPGPLCHSVRQHRWECQVGKTQGEAGARPDCACVPDLIPQILQVLKSHGQDYLVGNKLSRADIQLVELLYYVEEVDSSLISSFPLLQTMKTRISNLPTVKKFLQPGSARKPPTNAKSVEEARKILRF